VGFADDEGCLIGSVVIDEEGDVVAEFAMQAACSCFASAVDCWREGNGCSLGEFGFFFLWIHLG
jgi:hypothetical protein